MDDFQNISGESTESDGLDDLSFPELTTLLNEHLAAVRRITSIMGEIFQESAKGTLAGVRGRLRTLRQAVRKGTPISEPFSRQAATLTQVGFGLGIIDELIGTTCEHPDLVTKHFSDGRIIQMCRDCNYFDAARKGVLNSPMFDPFATLKHAEPVETETKEEAND